MINNDLTTRLRKRITTIPKPGSKPFDPPAGFAYTTMMGGEHKPGDPAGYASVNVNLTGCSTAQSVFKMQEMVYAEEPLSWEAAAAIEQLQAELADCHRVITIWDASDLKARPAVEQYARAERAETEAESLRAELEAVKADAERYRWLALHVAADEEGIFILDQALPIGSSPFDTDAEIKAVFDHAIEAARARARRMNHD